MEIERFKSTIIPLRQTLFVTAVRYLQQTVLNTTREAILNDYTKRESKQGKVIGIQEKWESGIHV